MPKILKYISYWYVCLQIFLDLIKNFTSYKLTLLIMNSDAYA